MTFLPPFGSLPGELVRAAAVALAFGLLFIAAEAWRRMGAPPVEWTRKFVHVGGGVLAFTFPWMFSTHWTVLGLAALAVGILSLGRRFKLLPSVTGVTRESRGEVMFPLAGYVLFALAHSQPLFYVIALFTLVVSDALAALLGQSYGRLTFEVGEDDRKSLEGSLTFFATTFLGVHLLLLLGSPIDRLASVVIATQIALLVTSFEAISMRGNDNLVVPLATYYLLIKMASGTADNIAFQLAAQLLILAFVLVIAWRTQFLTWSGAVAAHLVLYAAFSLGGPLWVAAPIGGMATLFLMDRRYAGTHGIPRGGHQVIAIYYMCIVAVLCIFVDNSFATLITVPALGDGHPFYPLYVGALAGPVAIIAFELRANRPGLRRKPRLQRVMTALGIGIALVVPLGLGVLGSHATFETLGITLLASVVALGVALVLRSRVTLGEGVRGSVRLAALSTLIAVIVATPVHFLWAGIRPWVATQ